MNLSEEKIWIEKAKAGDRQAISHLYQAHKDALYKFIFYRVGTEADSEDLFQDIMLAAFDSLERFRGEVPFLHWCYQIARNKIAYFWRLKGQRQTLELDEESAGFEEEWMNALETEEITEEINNIREKITAVMEQLPENYRTVLQLRFFEEKTIAQTAELMQITLSNAKVLQHRALKKAAQLYALAP